MRCPKCGFITFDHLETCTKCGKDISAAAEELSGTVFRATPPAFLKFDTLSGEKETDFSPTDEVEVEFSMAEEDLVVEEETTEMDLDLMSEESEPPISSENETGADFDFQLDEDDSEQLDLATEGEINSSDTQKPQLDFNELDISDLGPPESEQESASAELTLEDNNVAPPASGRTGGNLEDLQTDDLDLGILSPQPGGKISGKNLRPAVKTGTALDDFDIDLGELISDK